MIYTFTPNPSIDRAYGLEVLTVGEVNRSSGVTVDAGGKGINISRALASHGVDAAAIFPYGGADGDLLLSILESLGVPCVPIPVEAVTRSNITLSHDGGYTTKINSPGERLSAKEVRALLHQVEVLVQDGDVVVAAGSLAQGMDDNTYATVASLVSGNGGRLILDSSGTGFREALALQDLSSIELIKPNVEELEELYSHSFSEVRDIVEAVTDLLDRGLGAALVSLGENGLLYISQSGTAWAGGPTLDVVSSVGAGDMTLAGYLYRSRNLAPEEARCLSNDALHDVLWECAAWGRASVQLPGTQAPSPTEVTRENVVVRTDIDLDTALVDLPLRAANLKR